MLRAVAGLMSASVALVTFVSVCTATWAAAVRTPEQAAEQVHAKGFGLVSKTDFVSKTDKATGAWEVWASKDGVPYRVRVDADSGSVVAAIPAQDND